MILLLVPLIIAVLVVLILSFVYKGKVKTDKGFAFNYFGLSYRRKFIRTITTLPINTFALFVI